MIGVLSKGVAAIPHLESLLGESWTRISWWRGRNQAVDRVAGWGARRVARRARRWAAARGLPYLALEDGFLRSVRLGDEDPPLSIVADDLGLYFDSHAPSRLEHLINGTKTTAQVQRAELLINAWCDARVSKYNAARESVDLQPAASVPYVLVIDQSRGDPSISGADASAADFHRMLEAALDEQPHEAVVVKLHPEVLARRKRGHLEGISASQHSRLSVLRTDIHPATLIRHAQIVYVVSSQIGLEALIWGKPVRTFGVPFYAGWGLTRDDRPRLRRRRPVALSNLIHACLVEYMHCVDPESGLPCEVERLIAHLALQRNMRARFPANVHAVRFSRRKRTIARSFFAGSRVCFVRTHNQAPARATIIEWGDSGLTARRDCPVIRVEDGFLRSVGLGADLVQPLSWTLDRTGIHYDPTRPSDLEHLLASTRFEDNLLRRAAMLREQLLKQRITKYNVDADRRGAVVDWVPPQHPHIILVAGQVEDDASLRYSPQHVRTNADLVRAVRLSAPDAYIIYKRHPDVVAGLRSAGASEHLASARSDETAEHVPLELLFDAVNEVHVMTSLTGFEALIRGLRVVTYGSPFYAGWGLTIDHTATPRRKRILTLIELIAGALILYPTYVSRRSGQFTEVERVVRDLSEWREWRCLEQLSNAAMESPLAAMRRHIRRMLLRQSASRRRTRD